MARKKIQDPDDFWREYAERYNEEILAYTLGRYLSGCPGYDTPFWGLLIATSGGFRIHHFPHEGWIQAVARTTSGGEAPKEKTVFIPASDIISVEMYIEKSWWRKIFMPVPPTLRIRYALSGGQEKTLIAETDRKGTEIMEHLRKHISAAKGNGL